jgi:CubicO group peptidase (beta-lactamase class C family)
MDEKATWTQDERLAAAGMFLLSLGVGASLWYHLTHAAGAMAVEFRIAIVLLTLLVLATVVYVLRVRWGYAAGILVCLGLYGPLLYALTENVFFFSLSVYNVLVVLELLLALAVIAWSIRVLRRRPPARWWHAGLGVMAVLIVGYAALQVATANEGEILALNGRLSMERIRSGMADLETLDQKISFLMEQGDLPGLSAGIVVDDRLVWTGAYGEGITEDSLFNVGSIAKSFTATAVQQLAERGLIDLEADVNDYLPFQVRHPAHPDVPITTAMLLAHKSCLGGYTPSYYAHKGRDALIEWGPARRGDGPIRGNARPADAPDSAALFDGFLNPGGDYYTPDVWLDCRPGTAFNYSNTGYDLLSYLAEVVSGQSFDELLHKGVCAPLGMAHTARLSESPAYPQAPPHERVYSILAKTNLEAPIYGDARVGAGSLASTVPDMAKFLIAHLNQGRVGDVQLLSPGMVELMHRPKTFESADVGMEGYGYGWAHFQQQPWQYWGSHIQFYGAEGHGGHDVGYRARMFIVEEDHGGFGVVWFTNHGTVFKQDVPWFFTTYLQIETLLMEEAHRLWALEHGA